MTDYVIAGVEQSPEDFRDIPYRSPYTPEQLPDVVDNSHWASAVHDQGSIGSCVANGVVSQCELILNRNDSLVELSRLALYTMTKDYENRLGQSGLFTRDAYKVAYGEGIAEEVNWPYDVSKDNVLPPESVYQNAAERKVGRYEAVIRSKTTASSPTSRVHRLMSALYEGLNPSIAIQVTESIYGLTGPWRTHQFKRVGKDNPSVGGHLMYIVGYDATARMFKVQNSWGTGYGDGGYLGLPFSIVDDVFVESYVVRAFDDYTIMEEPGIYMERKSLFQVSARITPKMEDVGREVNVWVGAVMPDGTALMKQPTAEDVFTGERGDLSGGSDSWKPLSSGVRPVVTDFFLEPDNLISLVHWKNLTDAKGAKIYVAYGDDLFSSTAHLVCTI